MFQKFGCRHDEVLEKILNNNMDYTGRWTSTSTMAYCRVYMEYIGLNVCIYMTVPVQDVFHVIEIKTLDAA